MPIPVSVQLERDHALRDAQSTVNEYGNDITISIDKESNIVRDKYNSVNVKGDAGTRYDIKAYPVIDRPHERQLQKAGLTNTADMIVYTATKDWTDRGIEFEDIDINRVVIYYEGSRFNIKEKGHESMFADTHLYITFGLSKI